MPVTDSPETAFTVRPGKTRRYKRIRAGVLVGVGVGLILAPSPVTVIALTSHAKPSNMICELTPVC